MPLYINMPILSRPQTIWARSPDNQVELSEWATACFKHCLVVSNKTWSLHIFASSLILDTASYQQWRAIVWLQSLVHGLNTKFLHHNMAVHYENTSCVATEFDLPIRHYSKVTWILRHLKSLATCMYFQKFVQGYNKEKSMICMTGFLWGIHQSAVDFPHKGRV